MSKHQQQPSQKQVMKWFREGTKGNVESRIKCNNYWKNVWNKYSYESGSTMIHEKDYKSMNCCFCGKEMVSIHETHNPAPPLVENGRLSGFLMDPEVVAV